MLPFGLYDAHCHLYELDKKNILDNELKSAREAGVSGFFCSALGKAQFQWYQKNSNLCLWYAGIHPFFEESKSDDFDIVANLAQNKKIVAIGEIGLDKRGKNQDFQKDILYKQLDLALQYDLPVVFHIVGKYYELYKILKKDFPKVRGILHGFNVSKDIFEIFKRFDLAFSIGNKFNNAELAKEILKYGFFTLETDAPYQKPNDEKSDYNHLKNIKLVLDFLAGLSSKELVLKRQYAALTEIFDL